MVCRSSLRALSEASLRPSGSITPCSAPKSAVSVATLRGLSVQSAASHLHHLLIQERMRQLNIHQPYQQSRSFSTSSSASSLQPESKSPTNTSPSSSPAADTPESEKLRHEISRGVEFDRETHQPSWVMPERSIAIPRTLALPAKPRPRSPQEATAEQTRSWKTRVMYYKDPFHLSAEIDRLIKRGDLENALGMTRVASKNMDTVVPWGYLIGYYLEGDTLQHGIKLFNEMKKRKQQPSAKTYTLMFSSLAKSTHTSRAIREAVRIYLAMLNDKRNPPNTIHLNAVLEVCARGRDLESLYAVAATADKGLRQPDSITFAIMFNAMRNYLEEGPKMTATSQDTPEEYLRDHVMPMIKKAKSLWERVVEDWVKGRIEMTEKLVCAFGRLIMMGPWGIQIQVLLLLEQTMGIPVMVKDVDLIMMQRANYGLLRRLQLSETLEQREASHTLGGPDELKRLGRAIEAKYPQAQENGEEFELEDDDSLDAATQPNVHKDSISNSAQAEAAASEESIKATAETRLETITETTTDTTTEPSAKATDITDAEAAAEETALSPTEMTSETTTTVTDTAEITIEQNGESIEHKDLSQSIPESMLPEQSIQITEDTLSNRLKKRLDQAVRKEERFNKRIMKAEIQAYGKPISPEAIDAHQKLVARHNKNVTEQDAELEATGAYSGEASIEEQDLSDHELLKRQSIAEFRMPLSKKGGNLATPGNNTLSMLMRLLGTQRRTASANRYWQFLTSSAQHKIEPDDENWRTFLNAQRRGHNSGNIVKTLEAMPGLRAHDIVTAMLGCLEDKDNLSSLPNAGLVLDIMVKEMITPPPTCMGVYAELIERYYRGHIVRKRTALKVHTKISNTIGEAVTKAADSFREGQLDLIKRSQRITHSGHEESVAGSAGRNAAPTRELPLNLKRGIVSSSLLARRLISIIDNMVADGMLRDDTLVVMEMVKANLARYLTEFDNIDFGTGNGWAEWKEFKAIETARSLKKQQRRENWFLKNPKRSVPRDGSLIHREQRERDRDRSVYPRSRDFNRH
ncbi:hypothetical protein CFIMG_001670RA [Ceratocystis fimbriata CBS 114723]|uniref:Pentatricopeptide repeat protein n=1 Tax=Ceratocystis fimbriata CBS 114723 TaxID=1035309 RepID=A0A2C5XEY4_9PEZI|nr:hypothetical protein CFIMG_001670RA [Ceratocystis fimbriata CBS 114723]